MRTLSVVCDEDAPAGPVALVRTVLASVPAHFCLTAGPLADVVVVSGARRGWPARLRRLLDNGATIAVVVSCAAADYEDVRNVAEQARRAGAMVGVDIGFVHARFWTNALPRVRNDLASSILLDSVISSSQLTESPLVTTFLEQVAVVRSLVGALHAVRLNYSSADRYMVAARAGGLLINLSGLASRRGGRSLCMDLVGSSSRWRIGFDDDALARPGEISRFTANGAESQAPVFENSHRAMWLSLHAAVVDGSRLPYALDDLAQDVAVAEQLGQLDAMHARWRPPGQR
jgi:hypothetical protein